MSDSQTLSSPSSVVPLPFPPPSSSPNMKVIIIGGGMGGLALANGLQSSPLSSSFSFEVFEQGTPDKIQGYQLGIQEEGAAALSLLGCSDVLSLLAEKGVLKTMCVAAAKAEGVETLLSFGVGGGGVIDRKRLHLMLLSKVKEHVHFNKRLLVYEANAPRKEDSDGGDDVSGDGRITAFFDDGTQCTGDIIVAADGVHSQVRSQLLSSASHEYTVPLPVSALSFSLPLSRLKNLPHVHEVLLPSTLLRVVGPTCGCSWLFMVYHHDRVWGGKGKGEEEEEEDKGEKEKEKGEEREEWEEREEADGEPMLTFVFNHNFEIEGDFPDTGDARDWIAFMKGKAGECLPIQELLEVLTKDDIILGGPKHLRTGERGKIRALSEALSAADLPIAILGDAAHPMTTHRGLGANTAFEDARDLVVHLEQALTHTSTHSSAPSSSTPSLSSAALSNALSSYHESLFRRGIWAVEASLHSTNMIHMPTERGARVRNTMLWTIGSLVLWKRRVEEHPWLSAAVLAASGAMAYRYFVQWK